MGTFDDLDVDVEGGLSRHSNVGPLVIDVVDVSVFVMALVVVLGNHAIGMTSGGVIVVAPKIPDHASK